MHMRFAQNRGIFTEDKPFLLATYEAGRQVEMEKSLLKHIEGTTPSQGSSTNSKESRKKGTKIGNPPAKETENENRKNPGKDQRGLRKDRWESVKMALVGMPEQEITEHKKNKDNWLCCGQKV